jgi:hypothetical protein
MSVRNAVRPLTRPAVRWAALVALDALVVAALVVAALRWREQSVADRVSAPREPVDDHWWQRSAAVCIVQPPVLPAGEAELAGGEEVIGVAVGGKARAYRLGAFRFPSRHIVNDLIGGVPVSVTYCDRNDCARVYTDPLASAPLDVTQAGLRDGRMVVRVGGALYDHESGRPLEPGVGRPAIPYQLLPPSRTTWDDWKRLHPETDLYDGPRE